MKNDGERNCTRTKPENGSTKKNTTHLTVACVLQSPDDDYDVPEEGDGSQDEYANSEHVVGHEVLT